MVRALCILRALLLPFLIAFMTVFFSIFLFLGLLFGGGQRYADLIIRNIWSRGLLFLAGVTVEVQGAENLPASGGFLYLFTHSSYYDIPALFGWAPKSFRFGAKSELFAIPVFGWAMASVGTLKIARGERKQVMEVYKKAEERVAQGEAFALSPEGGRRRTTELAPFKSGPFIFAIHSKMPVVPTLILGAEDVLPGGSLMVNSKKWKSKIVLKFLPAVGVEGFSAETAKVLRESVRSQMVASYTELLKNKMQILKIP